MAENTDETSGSQTQAAAPEDAEPTKPEDLPAYGEDESQEYVDRSKLDFDPEDGLYTGTAVTGDSDIPNPDDVTAGEGADADEGSGDDSDSDDDGDRPKPYPHDGKGPDAPSD